jgi:glycine oxidase
MKDCIVVGKGIAGTVLSLMLLRSNKNIMVIDEKRNNSSRIAGGIFLILKKRNFQSYNF